MSKATLYTKLLLGLHLVLCCIWLIIFRYGFSKGAILPWMVHGILWSVLGVQFTWGFTVGMMIGPSRTRRPLLWSSLLLIFYPIYFLRGIVQAAIFIQGWPVGVVYALLIALALAAQTWSGVQRGIVWRYRLREK